ADERLPLDRAALDALLADRLSFTGVASAQVASIVEQVAAVVDKYPVYEPEPIL
ncbi:MAG: adenylosuccinate lyase, partial [Pseudonocardiales bacterium]|nr:adenylosuccinate lyase [Pseudonocardiales bacterium]